MANIDIDIEYISKRLDTLSDKFSYRITEAYNNASIFKNNVPYSIKSKNNINELLNNLKYNCHIIEGNFERLEEKIITVLNNYVNNEKELSKKMRRINETSKQQARQNIKFQKKKNKINFDYEISKKEQLEQAVVDLEHRYHNDDIRIEDMNFNKIYEGTDLYITGICESIINMIFAKKKEALYDANIYGNKVDKSHATDKLYGDTSNIENQMGNVKVVDTVISITNEMITQGRKNVEDKSIQSIEKENNIQFEPEKKRHANNATQIKDNVNYEELTLNISDEKHINSATEENLKNVETNIKKETIVNENKKLDIDAIPLKEVEVLTIKVDK